MKQLCRDATVLDVHENAFLVQEKVRPPTREMHFLWPEKIASGVVLWLGAGAEGWGVRSMRCTILWRLLGVPARRGGPRGGKHAM